MLKTVQQFHCKVCQQILRTQLFLSHIRVKENGRVQGDDRNTSLDPSVTALVGSVVGIVLVVAAALTYIWQRRKRKNYVPRKYK